MTYKGFIPKKPFSNDGPGNAQKRNKGWKPPKENELKRADGIYYYYQDGGGIPFETLLFFGAIRDPLTTDELNILHNAFGTLELSEIKKQLEPKLTPQEIQTLTWFDLFLLTRQEQSTNPKKEIEIDLAKISNGQSKNLLIDLILTPGGVQYDPKTHGAKQPGNLKEALKRNNFIEAANVIYKPKNTNTMKIKDGFEIKSKNNRG